MANRNFKMRTIHDTLQEGLTHHRAGRLVEAAAAYTQILRREPGHTDALNLSGVIARQQGDLERSERLIAEAVRRGGAVATYHHNLGRTYALQGRRQEAAASYRQALLIDPKDEDSMAMLAELLGQAGDVSAAESLYRTLMERSSGKQEESFYKLGGLLKGRGELQAAIELYEQAVSLFPESSESHFHLAGVLFDASRLKESVESYRRAVILNPDDAVAHNCLGRVLHELGEAGMAYDAYVRAVKLKPDFIEAISNFGALCMELGDPQTAKVLLRKAIELDPGFQNALCNLGILLTQEGSLLAAAESFRSVLLKDPRHIEALCGLGTVFDRLGDETGAYGCFQVAAKVQPDSSVARFNLSSHLLAAGDFAKGWAEYELRWQVREFAGKKREFTQPQWRGEELRGSRIFVYAEQGLGDTIQFARYAVKLAERGAEVILEVQTELARLLRDLHEGVRVIAKGTEPLPEFDWYSPLLSLPGAFGTELATIPAEVGYIRADAGLVQEWSQRVDANGLRVGVVWSGNVKHTRDRLRSIALEQFLPMLRLRGAKFYSLQKGSAVAHLQEIPFGERPVNLDAKLLDFTDTAAAIAHLDLVITVDTSVAHLAGAMGKPVWILLPQASDWRWLKGRSDSPWYPMARLFRQDHSGRWDAVLEQVRRELAALLERRRAAKADATDDALAVA